MKSRLAIIGMLVAGMLASTTGVGLAIDGLGGADASVKQYVHKPGGGVLGENEQNNPGNNGGNNGGNQPSGGNAGGGSPLQPAQQVEAGATGGGQLPFTGFLAIPVLIGGVVLLTAGLVLRRRAADDRS